MFKEQNRPQFNVLVTPKIIFYIGLMVNPPDTQAI